MKQNIILFISLIALISCSKPSLETETNTDSCSVMVDTVAQTIVQVEAVDLGLSVLWADRDLGATEPADCGGYYPSLKAQDTIASLWGDGWRLPTVKEMEELFHRTDRWGGAYIDAKGIRIEGKEQISRKNGKSIFLPAAGEMKGNLNMNYGAKGLYVTSTHTFNGQYEKGMWAGYWDDELEILPIPWHEITHLFSNPEYKYTIRPVKDK